MFRKKTGDDDGYDMPEEQNRSGNQDISAPPLKPFSRKGSHAPTPAKPAGATARHDIPRRGVEPSRRFDRLRGHDSESKKLTVGREIRLAGEITSCNKLVVEGQVEVSLNDAHSIEIAPSGYFKGSAEVEEADISGLYEGELIARDTLTVRAGGRINGTVRYGRIVIEAGGEISGDMRALSKDDAVLRGASASSGSLSASSLRLTEDPEVPARTGEEAPASDAESGDDTSGTSGG